MAKSVPSNIEQHPLMPFLQYRSCIFYADASQKEKASAVMMLLRGKGYEVNTLLLPLQEFWIGEEYHQQYYAKTGGEPYCHMRVKKF